MKSETIFSFFRSLLYILIPCSFNVYPFVKAYCLIAVLNSFEPVKYNIANAYSSFGAYKKSLRLGFNIFSLGSCVIVKLFVGPSDSVSISIFFSRNIFKNAGNTL